MVQIPDNVRPYVDAVVKHHFWLLLGVVPVVILPMVAFARGRLASEIDSARSQVESRLSAVKSVAGIEPHPNDAWSSEIDKATNRVKAETLSEWQKFWASQQALRVWPASLGQDFVDRVAGLKPGSKLPRPLLERYQNGVRALVRTLPSRMGADEFMVQVDARATDRPARGREDDAARGKPAAPDKPSSLLQWNPADQQRLYASFDWEKPPSTIQVLLAQEELWVYGVLADALARANKSSTGAFDAAVPFVETLAVGYPAAEDSPGGAAGGRIVMPAGRREEPQQQEGAEPSDPSMMEGGGGGGPGGARSLVRPPHPRFGGGEKAPPAEAGPLGEEAPAEAPASPDDLLRNWIYVDFNGRPLSGAEVTKSADARIVHLVPFVIRGVMDERRIDALLVDLATSSVPIDVRQVRINAGGGGAAAGATPGGRMRRETGMASGGAEGGFGPPGAGVPSADGRRPHDVTVELRGTVAIATPPDRRTVGLEAAPEDGAGEPAGQDAGAGTAEPAAASAGGGDR